MTKKEQKYIKSLKDENEGLRSLLIRFMDAVGKLTNIDDVVNMSLIPIMTEKTKRFKAEFKAEAYKEFAERLKKEIYTNIKNNTMTKSQYIAENYKCLSCDFIATSRGKNEGLKTAFKLVNNLVKEMVGDWDGKRKD